MDTEYIYAKGFNTGYCITKYEPNLSDTFAKSVSNTNDFFQGFFDGKEQMQIEKNLEQLHQVRLGIDRQKDQERELF